MEMILDQFRLNGKIALVTGCRRGIGKAMAEAGADIIGISAQLKDKNSEIEKEITAIGRKFWPYHCDFSKRIALYEFVKKVKQDFQIIDILVNNAGTILRNPAFEHPDEY